jgi:hypothetical protein
MADERELLRESFRGILQRDKDLAAQLDKLRGLANHNELKPALEGVRDRVGALEGLGADSQLALETIVNRVGRPVLEVRSDDYVVEGPEAAIWEARLGNATVRAALRNVIPSAEKELPFRRAAAERPGVPGWQLLRDNHCAEVAP